MTEPSQLWRAGGASVIGRAHVRRGLHNEDAIYWVPRSGSEDRFVIAVADGHGGPAYPRAESGAQLALQALGELLEWFFDEPAQVERLPGDLVAVWRRLVHEHLASRPLEQPTDEPPEVVYGTTLVAAAGTSSHLLVLQIGDGDLMLGYPDGRIERPLSLDDGLVGDETYSLSLDNAAELIKYRLFERRAECDWPDFALIATDGVSKSFVDNAAFEQIVRHYRELVQTEADLSATLDALPGWLNEVSENGSGDDASLCIASRPQAAA
jgi:serine/threonine protein phosphatase PrpC